MGAADASLSPPAQTMLILPLPEHADWRRPPRLTMALILLCSFVFLLLQGGDPARETEAVRYYANSVLPQLELPAYVADLRARGLHDEAKAAQAELNARALAPVLALMAVDPSFLGRLQRGEVVSPHAPEHAQWRAARSQYEALRARLVTERYALSHADPQPIALFAHMFLHGDLWHLLGNMVVLFVVGYTVEAALGALRFGAAFVLGGLAAAVPDLLAPPTALGLSLGASGAIAAIMAIYVVLFGLRKVRFFWLLLFYFDTARWPALAVLPVWLANELLQRLVLDPDGHVNYLAHFAGLLGGAVMGLGYRARRRWASAELVHALDAQAERGAKLEQAQRCMAQLQFERAALLYRDLAQASPHDGASAAAYFRAARLAQAPALADAARRTLLTCAARPGADPDALPTPLLAQAVNDALQAGSLPAGTVLRAVGKRLAQAGEFDTVEALLRWWIPRDRDGREAPLLLASLAHAARSAGHRERAERATRLMQLRYPAQTGLLAGG